MEKAYKFLLLAVLMALGATGVKAETISLEEVPFCTWDGWGADARSTGTADCAWVIGESTGLPYGDSSVKNYADLSNYTKLVVVVSEGTPRFLLNRDMDEGQFNSDESQSHLIEYPKNGTWVDRYFSSAAGENEGETVYTVDLKAIAKDKGFAHLHAIKGANWSNVTVVSMEVERQAKAPVGWTSIINNGNIESDDLSSFCVALDAVNVSGTQDATAEDGAGVNGSRAITVETLAGATEDWATQFFVKLNELIPEGTQWRFTMDVKADLDATVGSGSHEAPRAWFAGGIIPEFSVSDQWSTVTAEGTIGADMTKLQSIAFDLNRDRDHVNKFYFDNINFEVFKLGTVAEFSNDVVMIDFGFDTNIPELVKACGRPRLMFPMDCASVKVNGEPVQLYSVEGFADGRFYVFLENAASESDEVEVTFVNPADPAYRVIYASGAMTGQDVKDFTGIATLNAEIEDNDGYPYDYLTPVVIAADPEDGSFNLPNSLKDFKLTFDKEVDCAALVATINGEPLTVTPATDFATDITLTANVNGDLATDAYTIHVTKIYGKLRLADEVFGDTTYTINIGKVEYDPEDQPKEMLDPAYFANCSSNGIPEGFIVNFNGEERNFMSSYGSGPRMFDFPSGGDFTKGLYFREGFVEYGTMDGYALTLEAGKKYYIRFNSAMWKDNGSSMRFRILNPENEAVLTQMISNTPNVNGNTSAAVSGSTFTEIKFFPEADGNYTLRWESANSETADPGYMEILLANVAVKYSPNQVGLEYVELLNTALQNAKSTRDANADERYAGEAFTALVDAIEKYEAEKDGYTAPSQFETAAQTLDEAAQAMKDHRQLCDGYDEIIKKAIDVVRQNKENKFAGTNLYTEISEAVDKYHGTSEWKDVADHEADPEAAENWQLFYSYDVLTDDAALKEAIAELTDISNTAALLFTEGKSTPGGSDNGKGTGVAVLIERLRLGAEALKSLDEEDNPVVEKANNALTDNDKLAEDIKYALKLNVYGKLKEPDNTLFEGVVDETTLETVTPKYDMTAFVKNPNIYKQEPNMNFTDESVPGWVVPEGFNRPGLSVGWGQPYNMEGIAEDCMFQTWGGSYRVEQTITDLPAGVYTISYGFTERNSEAEALEGSFMYAKTSEHEEWEDGATLDIVSIGQAFPFAEQNKYLIEGIKVVDGKLTIGVNAGSASHTFFNDIRVYMTGAAEGFDYAAAYAELLNAPKEGDVNGDGQVGIGDIICITNYMADEPNGITLEQADVNGDGEVGIGDIISITNIMAGGE